MPERIQLSRARGWRMPAGAIRLDRATKWGNPFRIVRDTLGWWCMIDTENGLVFTSEKAARDQSLILFREYLAGQPKLVDQACAVLRGKTLACWCSLDQPCHGDIWLKLVNMPLACEAVDA